LILYAVVYTAWLKRATPQNIVIGGAAGAAPPVLGWVAVTGSIDPQALVLFLIIFLWTPPHFWALAIARRAEYAQVGIPMLPVTHGIAHTRRQIVRYTVLLVLGTLLPVLIGMSGPYYLAAALALDARFVHLVLELDRDARPDAPMRTFRYSVRYLMALFGALLVDHGIAVMS
jgi:protoheme IX farnesyltransferase